MKFPWDKPDIIKTNYPDGTSYVEVKSFKYELEYRINSYEDLWTLAQIKDVYDYNMQPLHIVIPNLLDAQADRRFAPNQSSNLLLVLNFLKNLNFAEITFFHPHNPEVVEAILPEANILDNTYFIKEVLNEISYNNKEEGIYRNKGEDYGIENHLILMSSDAGGFKPLMKLADKINWRGETESAAKSRKYEEGKSKLVQKIDKQDFEGKDVLIVDDICVYGGTFVGLAKMLKERNVGKLYLAISHLTVSNPNPDLVNLFDGIYTTNSKGISYSIAPIEILSYRDKSIEF